MIKFLMNLFNIGKKKDDIEVEVDEENGRMTIVTSRNLTPDEIIEIMKRYL